MERIGQILPPSVKLNEPERYILLVAALLHDLGMWIPKQEALAQLDNAEFVQFANQNYPDELKEVQHALSSKRRRWLGEIGVQRLAAAYVRAHHPKRFAELLLSEARDGHEALRTLIDPAFLLPVALVVEAHGWERKRVVEDAALEPREIGGKLVNLRYLAELLRLGDLLDLGEGRISELLWRYLWPLNPVSEAHWRKEAGLRLDRCTPDLIVVSGVFDIDNVGIAAMDAYALAVDWLTWLEDEINGCAVVLDHRKLTGKHRFGRLELRRDQVRAKGLVLGDDITFELDRDRLLELLGSEIYAEGPIFCRELLQNAMDATRAQMLRDHAAEPDDARTPRKTPWTWPPEIAGQDRYKIEIDSGTVEIDGRTFDTFTVRDRGIGMTLQQLRDYLLQIGRSYYRTAQFQQEFSFSSISRFGIGFVSCLAADEIEITTRARGEAAGLQLRLKRPSTHFSVRRMPDAELGTTVKLTLDRNRAEEKGWLRSPYTTGEFSHAILSEFALDKASPYIVATREWGLWSEMPVIADGRRLGPRSLHTAPHVLTSRMSPDNEIRRWFPFMVRSSTGEVVAEAVLGVPTFGKDLPIIREYTSSFDSDTNCLVSARGIWILNNVRSVSNNGMQVNVNFYRLPPHAITAGRVPRGFALKNIIKKFVNFSVLRLIRHTIELLRNIDPIAAAWWRFPIEINDSADLPPRMVPYRTKSELGWASEEEIVSRFRRFLLLPMQFVLREPWSLEVPCVGYLYPRAHRRFGEIHSSPLVAVENACTALLYPPNASVEGLPLFQGQMTYTPIGLYAWPSQEKRDFRPVLTIADGEEIEHSRRTSVSFALSELLPPYDRAGDPWREQNISASFLWRPDRSPQVGSFEEMMRDRFKRLPRLEYPEHFLDYTLADSCVDWE
ncbi:MAG TPA: ATP-binding protein [Thermoanaerobaculia bacterium]|nr:ATP-binding protein [Thermoanaerobaculia bacterium]